MCLLGLSDAGKTLLFLQASTDRFSYYCTPYIFVHYPTQLKFGVYGQTQNSMVENSQQYEASGVKVR